MKQLSRITVVILFVIAPAVTFAAFSDTQLHPYRDEIAHVESLGIVQGYADGTFRPNASINRAEFTKIIIESSASDSEISACDTGTLGVSDVPASAWFASYVCIAANAGIVEGYPDGTFRPAATINFAEAAKIVALAEGLNILGASGEWYAKYIAALDAESAVPSPRPSPASLMTRAQMAYIVSRLNGGPEGDVSQSSSSSNTKVGMATEYGDYREGVIGNGSEAILFFNASWCPSCAQHRQFLSNLPEYPVSIYKVDYDTETQLKQRFSVSLQDTFVHIDGSGTAIHRMSFPTEEELSAYLESL